MHPNPAFRDEHIARDIEFVRSRAFGTLTINGNPFPLTSHVPFILNEAGTEVELHLVRSNPIVASSTNPIPVVITCLGPDGYVSPDWYGVDDQVPTWNYIAVRISGTLERLPHGDLHALLERLSAHFETQLLKAPWTPEKMSEDVMERMMRMIVPYRVTDLKIESTWKLNQNKNDAARLSAAHQIIRSIGTDLDALGTRMAESKKRH